MFLRMSRSLVTRAAIHHSHLNTIEGEGRRYLDRMLGPQIQGKKTHSHFSNEANNRLLQGFWSRVLWTCHWGGRIVRAEWTEKSGEVGRKRGKGEEAKWEETRERLNSFLYDL